MRCDLRILYSAYQNAPQRLDDIVAAHLAALRRVPAPVSEQEAAQSLLPLLNQATFLEEVGKQRISAPIHRPFAAGLVITYVLDAPGYRAYMNQEMLSKIDAAPDEVLDTVHRLALDNLRKLIRRGDTRTAGVGDQTVIACETRDGYAATRLLLPDLMATWAERVPGQMLIGIPNRDFLVAFSDRNPQLVANMTRQIRRDAKRREHPLTPQVLVWQAGRISELDLRH
jgi:uncharacterized protein YtpQ (UPF0354 family)